MSIVIILFVYWHKTFESPLTTKDTWFEYDYKKESPDGREELTSFDDRCMCDKKPYETFN